MSDHAMMEYDESSLRALESLMTEFFTINTTNERKRDIEEILNGFSTQPNAWKHCLAFFTRTANEYVLMYCLTVLENFINRQWMKMPAPDKAEIRIALSRFIITHHQKVPNFISNKLGKLVVDIGRLDWPHFYPDFFLNIYQLAQSAETAPLGLMLLQTAFEELTSPREDLSMTRKEELRQLLLEQVPTVLNILCGHLEAVLEKHCHVTATPPPSPIHFPDAARECLFSTSPLHAGSLLSGIFKSSKKNPFHHMHPFDPESHHICMLSLKCLALLLSWMPLSSYVTSSLLTTVFHFASFGCSPDPVKVALHSGNTRNTDLGIQAMSCINEIMSRNCIPNDFEEFLVQMFQDTFHLMQHLTRDTSTSKNMSSKLALCDVNESFAEKFTDFLSLFVSLHLKRFEGNPHFPVLEFLALLFKYTFQQPTNEGFYSCLDIWNTFLDYLLNQLKCRNNEHEGILHKYKDALLALIQEILRKLQFRFNQTNLEELNDEDLDDDAKTEWQHFLRQCLEIISKVCDIVPEEVFKIVFSIFDENLHTFMNLEPFVKIMEPPEKVQLNINGESECRRLHCALRDLSSMLQAVGRLVEHMSGEHYHERKMLAFKTLERLCSAASYSNRLKFYDMKTGAPLVLRTDFVEVHAQIMATLKAFCQWLTEYNRENVPTLNECSSIETAIAEIVVPNIVKKVCSNTPHKVVHSAAHLSLSLTSTVRPCYLHQLSCQQNFFRIVCEGELQHLPVETQLLVYRSISNMLILPWPNRSDSLQDWMTRSQQHMALVNALSSPMKNTLSNPSFIHEKVLQDLGKSGIKFVLRVHCDLIESIADAPTRTKQLFHQSILQLISMIESLFHVYLYHSDVNECILDFFLCLFTVLKVQIGPLYVEQTMQNFLNLYTTNQLIGCILNEGTTGNKVIQKLLQLLQRIIQEPSAHTQSYLPSTISLCMNQIYPVVAERSSCEVKPIMFELLYNILLHNWRYFFKSHVMTSYIQTTDEILENEQAFVKIMEAYGHSFLLPDICLFRQNLSSLENLNSKWKLYHRGFFKNVMLYQFLNVLLQSLIQKTHNLLQEEISVSIYSMASVDFNYFFTSFLSQFLQSINSLDSNQKNMLLRNFTQEVDLPSFTQNTQRFVSDLRYYSICNSGIS